MQDSYLCEQNKTIWIYYGAVWEFRIKVGSCDGGHKVPGGGTDVHHLYNKRNCMACKIFVAEKQMVS